MADLPHSAQHTDRMGFSIFLALAIHAIVILGVGFELGKRHANHPTLDVTLARHQSSTPPDKADFLAQQDQQGSGTQEEKSLLTTDQLSEFDDIAQRDVNLMQQIKASQPNPPEQQSLVTTINETARQNLTSAEQALTEKDAIEGEEQTRLDRSAEIASKQAKLDTLRRNYARKPRVHRLTSLSTKRAEDASYLEDWRQRIERIGNLNYPQEARRKMIFGSLRLLVALNPDGSVHQLKVLQTSGHKVLDDAAIRIIRLAAPFAPFPQEMRQLYDRLEIIRTWRFHEDQLTSE